MIIRPMSFEEVQNHKWQTYKLDVTAETTRYDVINFIKNTTIKAKDKYPGWICPVGTEVILIKKDGGKEFTNYEHIYKGNRLYFNVDGRMLPWGKARNKIKSIVFMDNLWLHEKAKPYWSKDGFDAMRFIKDGIKDGIITELLLMI